MASPEYDEDVILPNSPLGQYLHGFEIFEQDLFNETDEVNVPRKDNLLISFDIKNKFCCLWRITLEYFKVYLSFIYNIFVPCLLPFEYSELKQILDIARNSKVLLPEDLAILLNYESDDESNCEFKLSYSSVFQQFFQLVAFVIICFILRSITVSNIITNDDICSLFSDKSYFVYLLLPVCALILSIALYINIFIISAFIITNLVEFFLCKVFCYYLKKKLHTTECIMIMLRKCIRLIQEAELVARGFTSASLPGIVERLELSIGLPMISPQRQYPELRKHVFMWTREMFMLYKSSTQKLLENKRFSPILDFSSQSLAMLDLKEFGNLLKYDVNFESDLHELLKLTDGLSVSSLKTVYLLLEFQVSEFYKYLYLITSFLISDDSLFHCSRKISYFHTLNAFIKTLLSSGICVQKMSCKTYKYYRSIEAASDPEDKLTVTVQKSKSSNFEICVHNMSLHLKAALKRLTDLEDFFEEDKKSELTNINCAMKVQAVMKEIKSEIDIYHDYYHKCNNELQSTLGIKKHLPPIDSISEKSNEELDDTNHEVITNCNFDAVIEDEIFEAFVTKTTQENETFSEYFSVEKQNQDTAVASRLLRELKNVLVVKANEHRIREERAISKNINKLKILPEMSSTEDLSNILTKNNTTESELSSKETFSDTSVSDLDNSKNEINSKEAQQLTSSDSDSEENRIDSLPKANSFAASIAALAFQRKQKLGIIDDTCFSDSNDSED